VGCRQKSRAQRSLAPITQLLLSETRLAGPNPA
jgi:hypothetical protein